MTQICSVPPQSKRLVGAINDSNLLCTTAEQETTNRSYQWLGPAPYHCRARDNKLELQQNGATKGSDQLFTMQIEAIDDWNPLRTTAEQETTNQSLQWLGSALYQAPQIKRQQNGATKGSDQLFTMRTGATEDLNPLRTTAEQETTNRSCQWLGSALYQAPQIKRQQNGATKGSDQLFTMHRTERDSKTELPITRICSVPGTAQQETAKHLKLT